MARELQVWSPMRELERFRREFDDLFSHFLGGNEATLSGPRIESFVDGDRLVVRVDLPGVDPKDVEVTVTGNILTLKGTRRYEHENKERDYIHREVSYGNFERSLTLPEGVKADQVKASYRNGVLELAVAMPESMAVRKVPVEIAPAETKR